MRIIARFFHSLQRRPALFCIPALAALVFTGSLRPLAAQPSTAAPEPSEESTPAPPPQAAAPQQPAGDGFTWGLYQGHSEIEIGYRWVSDVAGNYDLYRSMINLGEGPKLLRSNLSLRSNYGSGTLFDRLDLSINSWGGEPYNSFRLGMSRGNLYELRVDYRNLNYYNYIPTFANPLLDKGSELGQHSRNITYRTTDLELKFFPEKKIRPYFGYSRGTGFGQGFSTVALSTNEFLLSAPWHYRSDEYHGGLELEFPRLSLMLEHGYRLLKNDSGADESGDARGNNTRPYIGTNVELNSLTRGYHDRVTLPVFKSLIKFLPWDKLQISGRYLFSQADLENSLAEIRSGTLISLEDRLIYETGIDSVNSRAKRPNHDAAFTVEFSPFSRLTLLDQFETRRQHISGSALLSSLLWRSRPLSGELRTFDAETRSLLDSFLSYDQVRNQVEAEFDLGYGIILRGGHRYTYAETTLRDGKDGNASESGADFTQHTGIAGFAYRPGRWMRLNLDYESNHSDGLLTRTDLLDYNRVRFDWRVDPWTSVGFSGQVGILHNRNRQADIDLKSHNRNYSVAAHYEPSERFRLSLDYTRSNLFSDISILLPQALNLDRSLFDERGSSLGGTLDVGIYRGWRADFGYRATLNAGSFPLNYYLPFASMSIPLPGRMAFNTYWQYFGYNEKESSFQDHRSHILTFSIAYSY